MAVQENDETFPTSSEVWSAIGVSGKVLQCPTAGKSIANAYAFNDNLSGLGIGEIKDSVGVALTSDSEAANNLMLVPTDAELRHDGNTIMSFSDGHVETTKDTLRIVFFPDDTLMNNLSGVPISYHETYAESGRTPQVKNNGDFYFDIANGNTDTWTSMAQNGSELTIQGHGSRNATYIMPVAKFKQSGTTNRPAAWWGFDLDLRIEPVYTAGQVAFAACSINVLDPMGGVVAKLEIRAWNWDDNNYIKVSAGDGVETLLTGAKDSDKKPFADIINSNKKFSVVVSKDGDIAASYAGKTAYGKVTFPETKNFDGYVSDAEMYAPKIKFLGGGGNGDFVLSLLSFGCK